jgi:hypothetical protein
MDARTRHTACCYRPICSNKTASVVPKRQPARPNCRARAPVSLGNDCATGGTSDLHGDGWLPIWGCRQRDQLAQKLEQASERLDDAHMETVRSTLELAKRAKLQWATRSALEKRRFLELVVRTLASMAELLNMI